MHSPPQITERSLHQVAVDGCDPVAAEMDNAIGHAGNLRIFGDDRTARPEFAVIRLMVNRPEGSGRYHCFQTSLAGRLQMAAVMRTAECSVGL